MVIIRAAKGGIWRTIQHEGSYDLSYPDAMAVADGLVFVADAWTGTDVGGTVTDVNINGTLINKQVGSSYQFDDPNAVAAGTHDVFVANWLGNSVTEFATETGALVRVIKGS
jgi:hypothetical protein